MNTAALETDLDHLAAEKEAVHHAYRLLRFKIRAALETCAATCHCPGDGVMDDITDRLDDGLSDALGPIDDKMRGIEDALGTAEYVEMETFYRGIGL